MCQGRLVNITGDVLLASGVVAYLGAFDARYRKTMISDWQVAIVMVMMMTRMIMIMVITVIVTIMMIIMMIIMTKRMTHFWQALCKAQRIPCSNEFSLTNTLGDQVSMSKSS